MFDIFQDQTTKIDATSAFFSRVFIFLLITLALFSYCTNFRVKSFAWWTCAWTMRDRIGLSKKESVREIERCEVNEQASVAGKAGTKMKWNESRSKTQFHNIHTIGMAHVLCGAPFPWLYVDRLCVVRGDNTRRQQSDQKWNARKKITEKSHRTNIYDALQMKWVVHKKKERPKLVFQIIYIK